MTGFMTASLLLVAIPLLGTAVGLLLRGNLEALKGWLLLVTLISLGSTVWIAGTIPEQAAALPLLALLPIAAFVSLLGQPLHRANCAAWLLTLLLLGFGLGVLAYPASLSLFCLLLLLAVIGMTLVHSRRHGDLQARWGVGMLGLGMLTVTAAMTLSPPLSTVAFTIACAVTLPLVPFHSGYVAALTALPGNLPAFLALLLPLMGFHGLLAVLAQVPAGAAEAGAVLALGGMIYGSLKGLTQSRAASVVAYGGVAFFSILWWWLATTRSLAPPTVVYVNAVGLATSGLLLAWDVLRVRYGEIGVRALSGLAQSMPRFAVVLSLLGLAALGLPPFGVFSGFMGMLLAPASTWSAGLIVVILAWLSASWYVFDLMQGLLFGRHRPERRREDLHNPELVPLIIVLVLLIALGVMPSRLFHLGPATLGHTAASEFPVWDH
ncbi:proton-conducting transporter transmembrane domain-containing protein [Candidatus Nitrospira bockiana]